MNLSALRLLSLSTLLVMCLSPHSLAQLQFTVNSLADDEESYAYDNPNTPDVDESMDGICNDELGRCTLGAAISEADNMGLSVHITFAVEGVINLRDVVVMPDGSIFDGNGKIALLSGSDCMEIYDNTTVKGITFIASDGAGLVVSGNRNTIGEPTMGNTFVDSFVGLVVDGDSNEVVSNFIGVKSDGEFLPNNNGIWLTGSNNIIGKPDSGHGNTICGSSHAGIEMSIGSHNVIQSNFIGTTSDGREFIGNRQGLVIIGSDSNIVGGAGPAGNIISGNTMHGIFVSGAPPESFATYNMIAGNIIGLSPLQTSALPNGNGIVITGGTSFVSVSGNIISGNLQNGILLFDSSFVYNVWAVVIADNRIGVNRDGVLLPNRGGGIVVQGLVEIVVIGADATMGTLPNTIVGNGYSGITVRRDLGQAPSGILFRKNLIHHNGVTNVEVDTLANDGIKPPYGLSMSGNTLAGIHPSPGAAIDVYRADKSEGPPSAYQWLGSTTTGANGVFVFDILDRSVDAVSVTATVAAEYNTSAFAFLDLLTSVAGVAQVPTEYMLEQNYPNPFNPSTTIRYQLPVTGHVTLKVYDVHGREVATLIDAQEEPGYKSVRWDATGVASGVYFCRLQGGGFAETRKLVLMH